MVFTIRESTWLLIVGMLLYMAAIPAIESAEQTVIQGVVPYKKQGRVFGFAMAIESIAAPITAFLVAPLAQFVVIPYMKTPQAQADWNWLLGSGDTRGIAVLFLISGFILALAACFAFGSKTYRQLSGAYVHSRKK